MENTSLMTVFLTGLLTGGLTCMALQGGLLATTIAQQHQDQLKEKLVKKGRAAPIIVFLTTKLIAYTILGFLLGLLGSKLQLSLSVTFLIQLAIGIFMLGTALNLLEAHPIFRYFAIQPPYFLARLIRKEAKRKSFFAPAILGAFTVFIPCGTTQAMMALAIASANPLLGALILFVFVLGTSPVFFTLGYLATRLSGVLQARFTKVVAISLILLSVYTINGAIALSGTNFTLQNGWKQLTCATSNTCPKQVDAFAQMPNIVDQAKITFESDRYVPSVISVKTGSHVKLELDNKNGYGCVQAFTIPKLGIQQIVPVGKSRIIEFDAPSQPTTIAYMCSMGMFQGTINVIRS